MVGLCVMSNVLNHLNTRPVHNKTRWLPLVQYSKVSPVSTFCVRRKLILFCIRNVNVQINNINRVQKSNCPTNLGKYWIKTGYSRTNEINNMVIQMSSVASLICNLVFCRCDLRNWKRMWYDPLNFHKSFVQATRRRENQNQVWQL